MIPVAIIVGAALLVGTGLVVVFWNKIITTVRTVIEKIQSVVKGILRGVRVFLRKTSDGVIQITKNYSQDENRKWHETVVRRTLSEDEIPKDIRDRLILDKEFDMTDEFERQLALIQ